MNKYIVAILNQKGGVGKSLIAFNLAARLSEGGLEVVALDYDPQGSLFETYKSRTVPLGFQVYKMAGTEPESIAASEPKLKEAGGRRGIVVIDTPPGYAPNAREAIGLADAVVIPLQLATYDLDSAARVGEMVKRAQARRDGLPRVLYVFNRVRRVNLADVMIEEAAGRGIKPAAVIPEAIAFSEAAYAGRPLHLWDPHHRANEPLLKLSREVMRWARA